MVLNLASSAYKQPQQAIALLEAYLLGVPFDLVVNVDGYNEIFFGYVAARAGQHPVLPARGIYHATLGMLTGRSEAWSALAERIREEKRAERAWLDRVAPEALLSRSELGRALAGALALRHRERRLTLEAELQALGEEAELPVADLPQRCDAAGGGCFEVVADVWERSSLAMLVIAELIGAEYLHVLQPNQYVEGSKPLSAEERLHAWQAGPRQELVRRGYAVLRERGERLREAGVPFRDLTGLFADHSETLYRDVCCHVNLRGNELLAEAIAASVVGG